MLNTLLTPAVVIVGFAITTALTWLAVKYRAWIAAKVKNTQVSGVLARLGDFTFRVVTELEQTTVDQLKKDGKWNADEAAKVKQMAVDKIKSYLGAAGIAEALKILGLDNDGLTALIGSYIETQILKLHNATTAAA